MAVHPKIKCSQDSTSLLHQQHLLTTIPISIHNVWIISHVNYVSLLLGAHTIGISHCNQFTNRLYNFTGVGDQDPALDSEYAANLKSKKCRTLNDNVTFVEMDPGSFRTFDLSYYQLLAKRRGLFQSDAALTTNTNAVNLINQILQGSVQSFLAQFARSMEKMGRIGVKTGSTGEIRKIEW